jgi:hypothetical protein
MAEKTHTKGFYFHKPGRYRIRVFGAMDTSWSDRLGGVRITAEEDREYGSITSIQGKMRDQAELTGLLNTLYEQHFTLLSVQYIKPETEREQ